MTATAVVSAMRIRTAPPFVGRALGACQALLGVGGLRPLHSRPERRAGRRRPFWLVAAGCAAGCVKPFAVVARCRPHFGAPARRGLDGSVLTARRRSGCVHGSQPRCGVQLEGGRILHRRRVVLGGRRQPGQCASTSRTRTGTRRRCPRRSCRWTRADGCRPSRPCWCSWHPRPRRGRRPRAPAPASRRQRLVPRAAAACALLLLAQLPAAAAQPPSVVLCRNRLQVGDLGEVGLFLSQFDGVGSRSPSWRRSGLGSTTSVCRRSSPPGCWLLASWRVNRAEAAEVLLKTAKKIAGMSYDGHRRR